MDINVCRGTSINALQGQVRDLQKTKGRGPPQREVWDR